MIPPSGRRARVLLDANVLYPTVMRQMLLGAAGAGLFTPLWSLRILEEWARAAARRDTADEAIARGEIATTRAAFPAAEVVPRPRDLGRLHLPDENDIHVLAAAIAGNAEMILTLNAADFPRGVLAEEGLARRDPDGFLWELWSDAPEAVADVARYVRSDAERLSGETWPMRKLLKKARLPRLGKALDAA